MSLQTVIPIAPTPPDFYLCDIKYGTGILASDCLIALAELPRGQSPVSYGLEGSVRGESNRLPFSVKFGLLSMPTQISLLSRVTNHVALYCQAHA